MRECNPGEFDSLIVLSLLLAESSESEVRGLLSRHEHGTKSGTHAGRSIDLSKLHAREDHSRGHLTSVVDDLVLGRIHVEGTHAGNRSTRGDFAGNHADRCQPLDGVGAEGAIVAATRDDHLCFDDIRVHARLSVMRKCHQGPVGHHAGDVAAFDGVVLDDEVLYHRGVEELDIGHGKHLGEESGCHERRVFDDDIITLILVRDLKFVQQQV
mmetsp:Transcript_47562/g.40179  ORF Transcript_47562/g.40179 Transcript_47562/m.40179 type:complete len:212 (+) Transcript_47562:547-1182(+)